MDYEKIVGIIDDVTKFFKEFAAELTRFIEGLKSGLIFNADVVNGIK